ncbi:MAG: hypothetical protein Q8Q41_03285 [bacterium]|nr:hypothetical protein [bacterium]
MKKILIILITALLAVLATFFGWYLFFRNPNIPAGEAIRNILPFGSENDVQLTTDNRQPTTGTSSQLTTADEFSKPTADLFRISNTPIAGAVVFKRGGQTIVRYVDRATGHIYDVDLATLVKTKVANQTLPKIYEAYFRSDGNAVLLRSLKDDSDVVENLSLVLTPSQATLVSTSSPQATDALYGVSSIALRGDISAIAIGSGNILFYALRDTSSVVSSAFNGTGRRTLLASPFTDWRLAATGNSLVLYTKASASAPGYAYTLNSSSGALTKILGPLNGLAVIPNTSGNRVLYSYVENGRARSFAKNLQRNTLSEILPTTLAEKCVWSIKDAGILFCGAPTDDPGAGEPDNWYRGLTHFSDRVWFFDTNTDIAQVLVEPKQSLGIDIDVVEPRLSPDENYLIFINKTDLSLWALKLERF